MKKLRIIKNWAVVWTDNARKEYGVPVREVILSVEGKEAFNMSKKSIGRPKLRYLDGLAIFGNKKEAEAFRNGNKDFIVVAIRIQYEF